MNVYDLRFDGILDRILRERDRSVSNRSLDDNGQSTLRRVRPNLMDVLLRRRD